MRNKPESGCLTGQAEYSQSCECLGSCQATECSTMKSVCYLNADPSPFASTWRPPDVIHVISVPRPFPLSPLLHFCVIMLNTNWRTKWRMRLVKSHMGHYVQLKRKFCVIVWSAVLCRKFPRSSLHCKKQTWTQCTIFTLWNVQIN